MADPFSWAAIAAYAAMAGAAVSAVGSIRQGQAADGQAKYNQSVDKRNEILAQQDRQQAIETAQIASDDKARENKRQLAALRASYGTTGLEMTGSPLEVLNDSSIEMALDTRRVEYEGQARGREGALKILGLQDDSTLQGLSGTNAKNAGYMNAGASLLSGASSVASIGTKTSGFRGASA